MMTQNQMIINYIERFGSITPQEAINRLGVMRLAARIMEIEATGYRIAREMVTGKNRYGDPVRYARYKKAVQ